MKRLLFHIKMKHCIFQQVKKQTDRQTDSRLGKTPAIRRAQGKAPQGKLLGREGHTNPRVN